MNLADNKVQTSFQCKLHDTRQVLIKTFQDYKLSEIFLSFNGGKDCTVLLHFVIELFRELKFDSKSLICVHVQPANPFEEVEKFVRSCEIRYNISIKNVQGSIKETLFLLCNEQKELKACIMGCRRTDPYCSDLNVFQKTDSDWPPLMRINPLINWNHSDIWEYLRQLFHVPYCNLYDIGYTSLGDKINTLPNPHLKIENAITKQDEYKPAWELNSDEFERAGRTIVKR